MIISEVIGGLGNQMFQYAAGYALADRLCVPLRLDVSRFEGYALHNGFELSRVFGIQAALASPADMEAVLGWRRWHAVRMVLTRLPWLDRSPGRMFREPRFSYSPEFEHLTGDCHLSGYWQTEKYFLRVADRIRSEFRFASPLDDLNAELAAQMARTESISIHVRRGDYASNVATTAMHGLCSIAYYKAALRLLLGRVNDPHVFVFSDDIAWVRKQLNIPCPHTIVHHNHGERSHFDMHLMSCCKHHIIANSSFSWWGAWLNPREEKVVVAPRQWFAIPVNTVDLIPPQWIRL